MTDHQGSAWYLGTRASFDAFEPDHGAYRGFWFSSHRGDARAFGLDRSRLPQHNPGNAPIWVYEVRVDGRVKTIDIMAEAARYADDQGIDAPATWDAAAAFLQWARGYGVTGADGKTAVTSATLFQAGAVSKPVAAMAAVLLVQDGRLDL